MDIGMPTLLETETLADCVALCRALDLQFIELNGNFPSYLPARLDAAALLAVTEAGGPYFTLHADGFLNPLDFDAEIAAAYRRSLCRSLRLAKAIGAPVVNLHLPRGDFITLPDRRVFLYARYGAEYRRALLETRALCEDELAGGPVRVCIENTEGWQPHEQEAVALLLESPYFALTMDTGHLHAAGGGDEAFFAAHRGRLMHMHLHDALGRRNHLALGDGEIDLPARVALAQGCGCRVVLETKTVAALRHSVPALHALLNEEGTRHAAVD